VVSAVQAYSKINAAGKWTDRSETVSLKELLERMSTAELEAYAGDGSLPDWGYCGCRRSSYQQSRGMKVMTSNENRPQLPATHTSAKPGDYRQLFECLTELQGHSAAVVARLGARRGLDDYASSLTILPDGVSFG
jgi:hypothetical protein